MNTIGDGLNSYIEQAEAFGIIDLMITPEIFIPILMFACFMFFSFIVKKKFF